MGRMWMFLLAAGVIVVPVGAYLAVDGAAQWAPFTYSASYLAGLALFGFFYLFHRQRCPATLVWLGSISYALYLFHLVVIDALDLIPELIPASKIGLAVVLVFLVSWLVHSWIEKPSIALGRKLSAGLRRDRVAARALPRP